MFEASTKQTTMSANLYIVPHDFSSVGDAALKYAQFLAQPLKTEILLLHIINDNSKRKFAEEKLKTIIQNLDLSIGSSKVSYEVVVGNIFDTIPEVAKKHDVRITIMGTHGAVGMQKLFGSYAMKIIGKSTVPFLIVQDDLQFQRLDNIIVPITIEKESLQVINIAGDMAKVFNSKVHVIAKHEDDPGLNQQIRVRISLVKNQYEEKAINSEINLLKGKGSYHKLIMDYAKENKGDLIAVAFDSSNFFQTFIQNLITNERNLPCLVINAKLLANFFY